MTALEKISVTMLTKNSEATLEKALEPLSSFGEVILLDTGSTDQTVEIAKKFPNVRVHTAPFTGFGELKNMAASLSNNDWIFSLDSDESIPKALLEEIKKVKLDPSSVYSFPRKNFFRGKWINGCGWYPDRVLRLYNKKKSRFSHDLVHERVIGERVSPLESPIHHTSYETIDDFLIKMQQYSSLFAEQHCEKKRATPIKAILKGCFTFVKNYLLQGGIFLGYEGLIISRYNAQTTYYKYLKLWERNT